jgi:hypothetical protein
MARTNKNSLRLDADFTEDTIGFALETFLALLSFPRLRFTIEPFSRSRERWLGADARLDGSRIRGFRPFYMQFKRPSAYPDLSKAKVVADRKKLSLSVAPRSLFFSLRAKSDNHHDYQHNILLRLQRRLRKYNLGDAAYVCPLFLDRSAYRFHMHLAGLSLWPGFWRIHPWELEDVLVNHGSGTVRFERIPVLAEHISIPPHDVVNTARHSYSFDEAGTNLCFHSPTALPDGASSLAAFLKAVEQDFLGDEGKVTPDTAFHELMNLTGATDSDEPIVPEMPTFSSDDPIGSWLFWGDMLRRDYYIEQYAFIGWDDL